MTTFEIDIAEEQKARPLPDAPRRLDIRSNDIVFTRLMRSGENEPDDYLAKLPPRSSPSGSSTTGGG